MTFDEKVYVVTKKIPRGKVSTYAAVAAAIGKPLAYRAVAQALSRNRDKNTPCHRVVLSSGEIGGYGGGFGGGSAKKAKLLRAEGVLLRDDKINLEKYGAIF